MQLEFLKLNKKNKTINEIERSEKDPLIRLEYNNT